MAAYSLTVLFDYGEHLFAGSTATRFIVIIKAATKPSFKLDPSNFMCGRLALHTIPSHFADLFSKLNFSAARFGYNICPTQRLLALRNSANDSNLELANLRWGLIPAWAKDINVGSRMINARCETVAQKPSFRAAFKSRRCVILANGFFEWKKASSHKQPYYIHRTDEQLMCFAGLWESWQSPANETIQTATILTTQANQLLSPLHDRMPVMLLENSLESWLQPTAGSNPASLFQPWPTKDLQLHAVSPAMNRPDYDQPACIAPVEINHDIQGELF